MTNPTTNTGFGVTPVHPAFRDDVDSHELLDNPAPPVAAGAFTMTDHGGSVIAHPRLVLVHLGGWFADETKLAAYAKDLMENGGMGPLASYGVGTGTFVGAFHGPAVSGAVSDAQCQQILTNLITAKTVPSPDGSTLYALMLPDGSSVVGGQGGSCKTFCGYHGAQSATSYYSIQAATTCGPCNGGLSPFDAACSILAHEVWEWATDAQPGRGFYDDPTGEEVGDACAWQNAGRWGPTDPATGKPQWFNQPVWVNGKGCVMPVYVPPSQPQPDPLLPLYTWLQAVANYEVQNHDKDELAVIVRTILAFDPDAAGVKQ